MKALIVFTLWLVATQDTDLAVDDDGERPSPQLERTIPDRPFRLPRFYDSVITKDGKRLVAVTSDIPRILVVDLESGRLVKSIRINDVGGLAEVGGIALDSTENHVLIGVFNTDVGKFSDPRVELWNLPLEEKIQEYRFGARVALDSYQVCFWGDETRVGAIERTRFSIWDRDTGEVVEQHAIPRGNPNTSSLSLDPQRRRLVAGQLDGSTKIVNWPRMGSDQDSPEVTSIDTVGQGTSVTTATDGRIAVANWKTPHVQIVEGESITHRFDPGVKCTDTKAMLTSDGRYVVAGGVMDGDWELICWDLKTHEVVSRRELLPGWSVRASRLSPTDDTLMIRSYAGDIAILSVPSLELIAPEKMPMDGTIQGVVVANDDQHLISVDRNGLIKTWEVDTGKEVNSIQSGLAAGSVATTPDQKRLAVADYLGGVEVFDRATGALLFSSHEDGEAPRFTSPSVGFLDASTIAVFDCRYGLRTVNVETGVESERIIITPEGASEAAAKMLNEGIEDDSIQKLRPKVCLAGQGQSLWMASRGALQRFDARTGECTDTFDAPITNCTSISAAPDGGSVFCTWHEYKPRAADGERIGDYRFGRFNLDKGEWDFVRSALGPIMSIQASPSGELALIEYAYGPSPYFIIDATSGATLQQWGDTKHLSRPGRWFHDQERVVTIESNTELKVWSLNLNEE